MCPSYLDGDHALRADNPDTRTTTSSDTWEAGQARGDTRLLAWLCSFQGPRRGARPAWALGLSKLNSMRRTSSVPADEVGWVRARAPPGPVDISVDAPADRHEAG